MCGGAVGGVGGLDSGEVFNGRWIPLFFKIRVGKSAFT